MTSTRGSVEIEVIDGAVRYDGRTLAEWAPVVAERIFRRCGAEQVVLFGSVVRGDAGEDSDLDFLVVLPEVRRKHEAAVRVLRELRDLPVPIDVIVTDPVRLREERRVPGIVRAALREGRFIDRRAA